MAFLEISLIAVTVGLLLTPYPATALAPGILALAAINLMRVPSVLLYTIVALIPFGAFRKIGGLDLPWVFAAVLLALLILQLTLRRTAPWMKASPLWVLLVCYLLSSAISAALSPYPDQSKELFLLLAAYVFVLLIVAFLSESGLRNSLHRVIVWSVSLGSILSLIGYVVGGSAFTKFHPDGTSEDRFVGGAIDPNNQSLMILFALPLITHLALFSKDKRERSIMIGFGFLNLLGLMLTQSRSGFLMVLLLALLLLYRHRQHLQPRRIGILTAGAAIGAVFLAVSVPSSFVERQQSLTKWEDSSLLRRTSYLDVAWNAFQERPIFGSGLGSFRNIYAQSEVSRRFSSKVERRTRRAHNTYLEVLVGSGVLGLVLFLGILSSSMLALSRAERCLIRGNYLVFADLLASYRISFSMLLLFLLTFSDRHHKYLLCSIGLSLVAVQAAKLMPRDCQRNYAGRHGS